jgi:endoglucanase
MADTRRLSGWRGCAWQRYPGVIVVVGAVLAATAGPVAARAAAGTAFVRVNQIGYATASHARRAYLMASAAETGATFSVRNAAGVSVYSAPVGANLGKWSPGYPDVYALDFNQAMTAGTYTITVTGPIAATSPSFRIDTGTNLYAGALANSLSFYQTERDGPDFIANALRTAQGHLNDQNAMTYLTPNATSSGSFKGDLTPLGVTINAAGGWWDAGDYLKFVQTTSYTVDLLLAGVRDFPNQMGPGSAASDFTAEAKFGAGWLLRMWDDSTQTLYYQVGIGEGNSATIGDHDSWRLPQADDTYGGTDPLYRYIRNRPVFRAGAPGSPISPNLAGRDAAALAEAFQVFNKATRRSRPSACSPASTSSTWRTPHRAATC